MRGNRVWQLIIFAAFALQGASARAGDELAPHGGFENGFAGWSRWGKNANLITLESGRAKAGTNCARIQHGHNALCFDAPLAAGTAYELRFFYRLAGQDPSGQVALSFSTKDGGFRSGGFNIFKIAQAPGKDFESWAEFRQVFLPTPVTASCRLAFSAGTDSTLWLDDVSVSAVLRPAGLAEPASPWECLGQRTANPLFRELLAPLLGNYSVVCWTHDLSRLNKDGLNHVPVQDDRMWQREVRAIFQEAGEAGMGFLDLPSGLDGAEPWCTVKFHREQFRKYGARFDVWTEGSESVTAALLEGSELLNPGDEALGQRPAVSWVDPNYVDTQERVLRKLGRRLRDLPFVGCYYGKDEPTIQLPEGKPARWGPYGQAIAKEILEQYGFGRFAAPVPSDRDFQSDTNKTFRWIAYNRWMNDKFIESRHRLCRALHEVDPHACYSPANYWFMSGFVPYDYARLAACSDLVELDPYASSAEGNRGRGVFNHGFGAKFMTDLTGRPVRIVVQAFDYAGFSMTPENLREWVSQALRCGASAIDYYTLDSPRRTHRDRWTMMLYLSRLITRMNRVCLPQDPDTAILYTLYTHMSEGPSTSGDRLYAAHALIGELAGSWFKFVSDSQLERGETRLDGYKVVYLPLAQCMSLEATQTIEDYVLNGGILICGDAEAFSRDLAGNDTRSARERILGLKTAGPKRATQITLTSPEFGLPIGATLQLPDKETDNATGVWDISLADPNAAILAEYQDGTPAIISRKLGKGRVITFAVNPFAPRVTVDRSLWPALFKGLQQSLGCKVERSIWRFVIPAPQVKS
jgi:hypothetical protein